MIHTFEIASYITIERARSILNILGAEEDSFDGNPDITGLNNIKLSQRDADGPYRLEIVVNPAKLLTGDSTAFQTVAEDDLPRISDAFAATLAKALHFGKAKRIEDWGVVRIDYSFDIITPHVELYLELFQRGDVPYRFENATDGAEGSLYLKSGSARINFYNKAHELNNSNAYEATVKSAANVLRLEVQCFSPKVGYIKRQDSLAGRQLRYFFNRIYAVKQVRGYCKMVLKGGDYYTITKAEAKLIADGTKSRMLRPLMDTMRAINHMGSIHAAKEQIANGITLNSPNKTVQCSRDVFLKHLKGLVKRGLNPVPIPKRWEPKTLPGALTILEELLEQSEPTKMIFARLHGLIDRRRRIEDDLSNLSNQQCPVLPPLKLPKKKIV